MIPIDGWMSKTSDPIVIYDPDVLSGIRFPWDIPIEEFVYAFALITLTMLLWDRPAGSRATRLASPPVRSRTRGGTAMIGFLTTAAAVFVAHGGRQLPTHRFVMHGPGRRLHADHHTSRRTGFERNDLYPGVVLARGHGAVRHRRDGPRRAAASSPLASG